nr:hypothetical protein [Dyella sp. ASV24]
MNRVTAVKRVLFGLAIFSTTLLNAACGSSMKNRDIKQNPDPKMRYEITMTINDAPGPMESVAGYALYDVANPQCAPFDKVVGIYHKPPTQDRPIVISRVDDHTFSGLVEVDFLQDEDYFGLGVCHWKLDRVGLRLRSKVSEFVTSLTMEQIQTQQPAVIYLSKRVYETSTGDSPVGNSSLLTEVIKKHPEQYFTATLTAQKKHL